MKRYPALMMASSFLRVLSLVIILGGVGVSFWMLVMLNLAITVRIMTVASMVASLVIGVILYAMSDFYRCMMDIEANTRPKE